MAISIVEEMEPGPEENHMTKKKQHKLNYKSCIFS